jgi:hypothetical protein
MRHSIVPSFTYIPTKLFLKGEKREMKKNSCATRENRTDVALGGTYIETQIDGDEENENASLVKENEQTSCSTSVLQKEGEEG